MFDIILSTFLLNRPNVTTQNQLFCTARARALFFFDICKYLKDDFLHGLGVPTPNMNLPKNPVLKAKFNN